MKCPKCGKVSKRDFCIYCGYKEDGTYIRNKQAEETLMELYFGEDFDKVTFNNNLFSSILLGPLYFIRYKLFFIGIFFTLLDSICNFIVLEISTMTITSGTTTLIRLFYFIFERLFWATLNNIIVFSSYEKKLQKIKLQHSNDYKDIIYEKSKKKTISYFILIFIIMIILSFYLYFHNLIYT